EEQYNKLIDNGIYPKYRHTACSAAVLSYPETIMDMVRVGISQYGFWPSMETYMDVCKNAGDRSVNPLRRIISWKSKVMSTKFVKAGDFIGYGTVFMATRDTWAATVPVGYANGFARVLSNSGVALIRGIRASVIGMVNMNMMMIDTTDIGELEKGEEVVLIGPQGQEELTVASFGKMSNLLNYELLTRLPLDIPRYIMES
ncbi:MAG: alanine racemase, partial [Bacteroidetes bacterium SW_10_40_5]